MNEQSRAATRERIEIAGAGRIEAVVESPAEAAVKRFGVVCHPHPLYGGTLDNKVVYTVARALLDLRVATLRFNFRGVGSSTGTYSDGIGETDDVLAVIDWGRQRWPGAGLTLAGFSFGAYVALRAAARAAPDQLITVAPPVGRWDLGHIGRPDCPWLIVQGDADELVDHRAVLAWVGAFAPSPDVVLLPGVDHFFHGKLAQLRAAVRTFAQ